MKPGRRGDLRSRDAQGDLGVPRRPTGRGDAHHPSLARELPGTGDILIADDLRHRVIVVDRASKRILWQYGVTDTPGHAPGYLYYPDGFDIDVFRDWKGALAGR